MKYTHDIHDIHRLYAWQLAYLASVQRDCRERECGYVQGAILDEPADVAHSLPEPPAAIHKTDLRETTQVCWQGCFILAWLSDEKLEPSYPYVLNITI